MNLNKKKNLEMNGFNIYKQNRNGCMILLLVGYFIIGGIGIKDSFNIL